MVLILRQKNYMELSNKKIEIDSAITDLAAFAKAKGLIIKF